MFPGRRMVDRVEADRRELLRQLKAARRPGKLDGKAYLGSPVPVLGVPVPAMRAIATAFRKSHRDLGVGTLNRLAAAMWGGPTFEERAVAITLLEAYMKILDGESWSLLDRWAGEATGWGLCDWLGLGPIAKIAYREPRRFQEILRWTKSKNLWRRRIAAYAVRDFVFAGELDEPFRLLERLVYDPEFWVQRAVGTWLRECWKKNPRRTEAFLRKHVRGLPKVVITVATERAPPAFREELRSLRGQDAR
jgi:3-methyladenine DNA glycosylase AlkD